MLARAHARATSRSTRPRRRGFSQRARTQRAWMDKGTRNAVRKAKDGDKHAKAHARAVSEKQAAKAAQTDRLIERLDVVDEPRKEWELQMTIAAAPRAGAVRPPYATRWCGATPSQREPGGAGKLFTRISQTEE